MKIIAITGSVGTGKTALAKKLAHETGFKYVDVDGIIIKYGISEGYDRKRKTKIVDITKLNKAIITEMAKIKKSNETIRKLNIEQSKNLIKKTQNKKTNTKNTKNINHIKNNKIIKGIIIDSHLSHYLPKKHVDLCIVTKCNLKTMEGRLKKRGYDKNKIRENMDAEIFDVCLNEAMEMKHNVLAVDTTEGIDKAYNKIKKAVKL